MHVHYICTVQMVGHSYEGVYNHAIYVTHNELQFAVCTSLTSMQAFGLILFALFSGSFASECTSGYQVIAVNNTTGSCNNSTCLTSNGTVPCCVLEAVLRAKIPPCLRIVVEDDQMFDSNLVVNGSRDLVLEGKGPKVVTISCNGNLSFTNCQNVNISGLQFNDCPFTFQDCVNVTVTGSTFSSGSIVGLTLLNVNGSALISNTRFVNQAVGLLIHKQSSTDPGQYRISNCAFLNNKNKECSNENDINSRVINRMNYGGGLLVLVEKSINNTIELVNGTTFKNNTGSIGGGAYFSINGRYNELIVNDTTFEENIACTLGGGLYIDDGDFSNNSICVSIAKSFFISNEAPHGAGLAYRSVGELPQTANYSITLSECNFTGNKAKDSGGALGFYSWTVDLDNDGKQIFANFDNCLFKNNSIHQLEYTDSSTLLGIGIIYTDGVNIAFSGETRIVGNQGTAILASSATIYMSDFVCIAENTGIRGGGIYLVGGTRSRIVLRKFTELTFYSNQAYLYGGAIFHSYPSLGVITKYCIFEYENPTVTDPAKWLANITFKDNTAGFSGNSIYISSPASCHVSNKSNMPFTESIYHFDPIQPHINQVVSSPVRLEINKSEVPVMLGQPLQLEVTAYDLFDQSVKAPVVVTLFCRENDLLLPDEQCHFNLEGTRLVQINEKQDQDTKNNRTSFFITGPELDHSSEVVLIWQTLENAPVSLALLNVTIKGKCKIGFVHEQQKCVCSKDEHIHCNTISHDTCIEVGYWYGKVNNTFEAVLCPFGNCNYNGYCPTGSCNDFQKSYCNLDDNHHDALCYGNRAGLLCSECQKNTSFTFDAIQCTDQCSSVSSALVIFLVLLFWAILVVTLLVVIGLDLHIGSGQLYCFFFFFSVLQYFVGGTFPLPVLYEIELVITGFIQLDPKFWGLIPSACLPKEFPTILYTIIPYAHPLFLAAVILLLVCCSRKYRLPLFHERRSINAICILLYLSFFSLTQTSLSVLAPVRLAQDNNSYTIRVSIEPNKTYGKDDPHLVSVAIAIIVQLTLVIPFLIILIFSPLLIRFPLIDKIFHRLKPILDEFQGCYKDSCRSFAGFYLLWRQIIFLFDLIGIKFVSIYLLQISSIIMLFVHAVFQPYEKQWLNALDAFFITDLLLLSILHGSTANVVFASDPLPKIKQILVVLLVFLPLAYFAVLCIWPILKRIYTCIRTTKKQKQPNSVYQHTEDEREPILFEQSVVSNNPLFTTSNPTDDNNIIKPPTRSIIGISSHSGGSYRSAASTN